MALVSKKEIYSGDKKPVLLCKAKGVLDFIADHGNVLIVEHQGKKFSIKKEDVEVKE